MENVMTIMHFSLPINFLHNRVYTDTFKSDTVFDSFHHQAMIPISNRALLAGFLMLWLKKCVVPTLPHKVIIVDVVCAAVLLAYSWFLGLLPTMVGYL